MLPSRPAPPPASGHGGPWGREVPWPGPPSRGGDAVAGPRKQCVCGVGPSSAQPPTARRPRLAHTPLPGSPARSHVLPRPCRGPTVFGQAAEHGAPPRARAHHPAAPAPAPPGAPSPCSAVHPRCTEVARQTSGGPVDGRTEGRGDGRVGTRTDGRTGGQTNGWAERWMALGCVHRWETGGWVDNGWVYGRTDGWVMDA